MRAEAIRTLFVDSAAARTISCPIVNHSRWRGPAVGIVVGVLGAVAAGCHRSEPPKTVAASPSKPPVASERRGRPTPPDREIPPPVASALPKDAQGRPILIESGGVGLVYDSKLDDPITRWGACLSLVADAHKPSKRGTPWIDLIKPCPTNAGGKDCCPPECIEKFKKERAGGSSDRDAMARSFVEGSCVEGLAQLRSRAQP